MIDSPGTRSREIKELRATARLYREASHYMSDGPALQNFGDIAAEYEREADRLESNCVQ